MTVTEFIAWLESLKVPNAVVMAFDPDGGGPVAVTGAVFDADTVELYTDEVD